MMRRTVIAGLFLAAAACAAPPRVVDEAGRKPNIIIILADDLGYGDLGVQGGRDVVTPNIDRLAREGVRMTDFYSSHPVCAPSRAGLLTGRYQQRFGFETNPRIAEPDPAYGIPLDQPTLAERLKQAGYATGMVGKWHVGYVPEKAPNARGFDMFYGTLNGAMAYVPDGRTGAKTVMRNGVEEPMPAHVTEAWSDESVKFIEANRDRPFFLYASFTAVHAPLQSTQPYLARFADVADPDRRAYLAMLAALDDAVGAITAAVDRNGLGQDTLIVFTSDNGGPTWQTTSANTPLNGIKGLMLDGGIRVPTIFRWTGRLPAGAVSNAPGISQDITATALAAAHAPADPQRDGQDLGPILAGGGDGGTRALYWRSFGHGAIREGRWKALKAADHWYLFDLDADIGERHDLAAVEKATLDRLKAKWEAWSATLKQPAWNHRFMDLPGGGNRDQLLQALIDDYVAGRPVSPRAAMYGGGPE